MNKSFYGKYIAYLLLILLSAPCVGAAQQLVWQPVTDDVLSSHRGGFVLDNGLIVDLRLDRQMFINGNAVSGMYFDTSALGKEVTTSMNNEMHSVLQNHLSDQVLSTVTYMDISLSNFSIAEQNLTKSLQYDAMFNNGLGH